MTRDNENFVSSSMLQEDDDGHLRLPKPSETEEIPSDRDAEISKE